MIKIIEQGQKTFTRTCSRCGCKFQYDLSDLSGLDYINCPCCHTTLTHIGPHTKKVDLNTVTFTPQKDCQPYKIEIGDGGYNYGTTTGQYINPNTTITIGNINKPGSDYAAGKVDPSITIYANKLPDDIVGPLPGDTVSSELPNDILDTYICESQSYKSWHDTKAAGSGKLRKNDCKG